VTIGTTNVNASMPHGPTEGHHPPQDPATDSLRLFSIIADYDDALLLRGIFKLFDVTADVRYLEIEPSLVDFVLKDLKDTPAGENATTCSYTPYDSGKVINAGTYRAFVLFEAMSPFGMEKRVATP
jgi:hypothetical protein